MGENTRTYKATFNGGELTPEFFGQIADAKFQSGLALCRNFVVKPQGPVENRAGFAHVREVKDSTKRVCLLEFTYSTTQTMIIEMGHQYARFHTMGGTLLSGAVPYEIATPYLEADLFDLHTVQSGDVLTIVHPGYAPRELRRLGATNWTLTSVAFNAPIGPPTNVIATPNIPNTDYFYSYVVTAVGVDGLTQSPFSAVASCDANLFADGARNVISWTAPVGAPVGTSYLVYKNVGGSFGYIGRTTGLSLADDNIAPDLSVTPPLADPVFQTGNDYPAAVAYYEQRRFFGGTYNAPQKIWGTRSGTESDMSFSLPIRDDDRISFRIAAREANTVRHLIPLSDLLILTSSAEFRVTAVNTDALTPTSISVKPQSYVGASNVQPVIINNNLVYAAARGGHVREMAYSRDANGYASGDLSLRAIHLFDDDDLVDMSFSKAPIPIVWAVSSSGKLLGFTYIPEQQVGAWHQHDTDGAFESCAVVAEGREDSLYVVVRRTIGGVQKRFIERQASRRVEEVKDGFFVDCGATYNGVATTVVTGLDWLNGKTVNILGDGAVHPPQVVVGGKVTLDNPASLVHVGLPIVSDIQTLPMAAQIDSAFAQGRKKNINKVTMRVVRSSGIYAGPSVDRLVQYKLRTTEPYGTPPRLRTGEVEVNVPADWQSDGAIVVRQSEPLPITIVSMTLDISVAN
jgi:hypothetical protein